MVEKSLSSARGVFSNQAREEGCLLDEPRGDDTGTLYPHIPYPRLVRMGKGQEGACWSTSTLSQ